MAYRLKKEYEGLLMNFPELNMRNITTDDLRDASVINKLMNSGHAGYFEPEEPIETNIEIVIDEDLKKKQDKEAAKLKQKKEAEELKIKEKELSDIQSQLTALTSTEVKKDGRGRKKLANKTK